MKKLFMMSSLLIGMSLLTGTSASAQYASIYTSVKPADCQTIKSSDLDQDAPIDYYTGECVGLDGYKVIISGGDLRYSLSLKYESQHLIFTQIGQFHDMGASRIEWRGLIGQDGRVKGYTSLIYRLSIADAEGGPDDEKLFVVRLSGSDSCLIGVVDRSPNMNRTARKIADNPAAACLPIYE